MPIRTWSTATAVLGALCLLGPAALADVAHLRSGRTLLVDGYRVEDGRIVLLVTGGGEIALPSDQVLSIRRTPPNGRRVATGAPPAPQPRIPPPVPDQALSPAELPQGAPARDGEPLETLPAGGVFDQQVLRDLATRVARRYGVDEALVQAVILVESRYDAFAVSPRGAMGLMQLMPGTAQRFEVENAFDPVENVDAGVRYLKELLSRYSGETRLALAAYNAGELAVDRHRGVPPYRETVHYVHRVLSEISN